MNIDMKALKGVVDEIEASRARQKGEAEFQREAIKRAVKNHQLDAKAIRIVLQRRAMGDEKRDEQDYYVHAYEVALGEKKHAADALAAGAGVRETARATGLSVGTVSALKKGVQKSPELNTSPKPEDGDDGITEITPEQGRPEQQNPSGQAAPTLSDDARAIDAAIAATWTAPATPSVGAVASESERVAPPFLGDDPGPPPDFLRSRTAQGRNV